MKRRAFLHLALGAALPAAAAPGLVWRERMLLGFGTTLWLRAADAQAARVEAALDAAVAALRHVESQMSLFDPASALVRLNRDGHLERPDADLLEVLRIARDVARRSGGAFDPTVQPLWATWQRAAREGRQPGEDEIAAALRHVGWRGLQLEAARVALRPGMALTLNGIAQGYAADRAAAALRAHGIGHALLDTGEWAGWGRAPQGGPWVLGIADPHDAQRLVARLHADGRAVATSSDATLAFTDDRREHHVLDPRRGHSPAGLSSVTVVARRAVIADALTKVIFMAGWHGALREARRWGVDALVVDKHGRWQASAGLALPERGTPG